MGEQGESALCRQQEGPITMYFLACVCPFQGQNMTDRIKEHKNASLCKLLVYMPTFKYLLGRYKSS